MVKLDQNLSHRNPLLDQVLEDRVFGSFDVHLQEVDSVVPQALHRRVEADHRHLDGVPAVLPGADEGMGNEILPGRKVENPISVKISNTDVMKMKLLGKDLRCKPGLYSGRRVERVNGEAIALDQAEVEGNILTNAQGIDDRAGADQRRVEGIAAIVGADDLQRALDPDPWGSESPLRIGAEIFPEMQMNVHAGIALSGSVAVARSCELPW